MAEEKYYKIGEIVNEKKSIAIVGDLGQGFGFKDEQAFIEKKGICYIPEHSFTGITGNDNLCDECNNGEEKFDEFYNYDLFIKLAKEFKDRNKISDKYSVEDIAKNLFDSVDWQFPETLISDWENSDTYID